MSSSFKQRLKEMRKEKHKGRKHPKNVRTDQSHEHKDLALTDVFGTQKPVTPTCSDCGTDLTGKPTRWVKKEEHEIPYCRGCFLTRFGKSKQEED